MLSIISPAFEPNGSIPPLYTCDSENKNPPLIISGVPEGAKSLTLIMDDPDIPQSVKDALGILIFDHWLVFNIPPSVTEIQEGAVPPGVEGNNTRGAASYRGPCPPDREHRYFFRLYALDAILDLPLGASRVALEEAMKGHILESAELMGRYNRSHHT